MGTGRNRERIWTVDRSKRGLFGSSDGRSGSSGWNVRSQMVGEDAGWKQRTRSSFLHGTCCLCLRSFADRSLFLRIFNGRVLQSPEGVCLYRRGSAPVLGMDRCDPDDYRPCSPFGHPTTFEILRTSKCLHAPRGGRPRRGPHGAIARMQRLQPRETTVVLVRTVQSMIQRMASKGGETLEGY